MWRSRKNLIPVTRTSDVGDWWAAWSGSRNVYSVLLHWRFFFLLILTTRCGQQQQQWSRSVKTNWGFNIRAHFDVCVDVDCGGFSANASINNHPGDHFGAVCLSFLDRFYRRGRTLQLATAKRSASQAFSEKCEWTTEVQMVWQSWGRRLIKTGFFCR